MTASLWYALGSVVTALVASLLITPLLIRAAPRLGLLDEPGERRIHATPTPRAGGIAVFLATMLAVVLASVFAFDATAQRWVLGFSVGAIIILVVGIIDDRGGMRPAVKLTGQLIACGAFHAITGQAVTTLFGYELPVPLDVIATLFWCAAIINGFNLIDGMDGLCAGLAVISGIGVAALGVIRGEATSVIVMCSLIGACIGFLRYNFHPARIFLGDAGSMFIGYTLAVIALGSIGKSTVAAAIGVPFLAAGVPLLDTLLAIWRRSVLRAIAGMEGQTVKPSIATPDQSHLHHRLLFRGFGQRQVALALYGVNAVIVIVAFTSMFSMGVAWGGSMLLGLLCVWVVVRHLANVEVWATARMLHRGLTRPPAGYFATLSYIAWDVALVLGTTLLVRYLERYMLIAGSAAERIDLVSNVLVWTLPVVASLVIFRVYQRVWSNPTFRDFLMLAVAIGLGYLVGFALRLYWADSGKGRALFELVFGFAITLVGVMGARAVLVVIREWLASLAAETAGRPIERIVAVGAGRLGVLFSEELRYRNSRPDVDVVRTVVAFVDTDVNLRGRLVADVRVIGTMEDLDVFIQDNPIDRVVFCGADGAEEILQWAESRRIAYARFIPTTGLWTVRGTVAPYDEPYQTLTVTAEQ